MLPKSLLSQFSHWVRFASILVQSPRVFFEQKKYLFILSHMRSYSTLLSHILGSNSEIKGHSEMFYSYQNWYDLLRLKYKIYIENGDNLRATYLLDKMLYNSLSINQSILKKHDIYIIIMIRKPYPTIQSIARLKSEFQHESDYTVDDLVNYYIDRLDGLRFFIENHNKNANICLLTSEMLIEDTDYLLAQLSQWLSLREPLTANYSMFENTGKLGKGDPSTSIRMGKIDKQKAQSLSEKNIDIPEPFLCQAEQLRNSLLELSEKYEILRI